MSVKHDVVRRIEEANTSKCDINAVVLDYLTVEGFPSAAASFSKETDLHPLEDGASIRARQKIQNLILTGDIQTAIETLNELDPQILDQNESLLFSLLRLQLVELIRSCNAPGGDITPALNFASEQLGPRAPHNPKFLEDLEQTMALLLFPHDHLQPQLLSLFNPDLRRDAASSVNQAMWCRMSARRDATIRHLLKMRAWAEYSARDTNNHLPSNLTLDHS